MENIPEKLLKPYDPSATEPRIYKTWEESGFFNPDNLTGKRSEPFTIMLPPPNVTGILHMGSALMVVIEDIMIRYKRMRGYKTLWLPGTDSAALATQTRVEKEIQKKEGKSRHDLGREELLSRIDIFVEENKTNILKQFRAVGASLDWSRYAYTMDKERYHAVMTAFVRMYNAGLIYRGNRIVNWDPKGQTVISDDEIVYEERKAKMYTFKYSKDFPIAISTTRPETKVGDTAVAVHPDDTRYKEFVGKEYDADFCGVPIHIKIIADESVEKDFGTGALGVTPAHSMTDWEIADRHNLPRPQVINEYAKMTVGDERLFGKKTTEAREIVVEWLKSEGLLEKEEEIAQNVSTAERSGGIIEPLPKLQWFIAVNKEFVIPHSEMVGIKSGSTTTLKEIMWKPVLNGEIKMIPEQYERVHQNWVKNLRDWCISRQIWFGHRIPIWYKDNKIYCGTEAPKEDGWIQDEDVLDTWFSSALWTFSTLGWPQETEDLKKFHPTSILETGYDILPFWVARMIMMSGFYLGQIPFHTVYFHGLVRDEKGQKISKSLGNNIDPIDMGIKYGMDAVRMSLIVGTAPGADSKISEDKIKGYKHFANKVWNITRFVETLRAEHGTGEISDDDQKLVDAWRETARDITGDIENYRFHLASEKIYHYLWHEFADKLIEESKLVIASSDENGKKSRSSALGIIFKEAIAVLHPFMPFVTEEIWGTIYPDAGLLMVSHWPVEHNARQ